MRIKYNRRPATVLPEATHETMARVAKDLKSKAKAPEPKLRSASKYVYRVIKELGGATPMDVAKYLPALDEWPPRKNIKVTQKRVRQWMKGMVHNGYLILDSSNDHYYVAPKAYYDERQRMITQRKQELKKQKAKEKSKKEELVGWPVHVEKTFSPVNDRLVEVPYWYAALVPIVIGALVGGAGVVLLSKFL